MGAQKEDPDGRNYDRLAQPDEGPVHEVTLSPFLAKYEVTQAQWHAVMGNYPSHFDGTENADGYVVNPSDNRDRLPVERVSWDDIQMFEATTGLRLPTEAQWEYACRGGTETSFSFGSGEGCADLGTPPCAGLDPYLWYCGNSGLRTHEVGSKLANAFGLHDMDGNVVEWCEDANSQEFYFTPEATRLDPRCASGSGYRVTRGGCWYSPAWECRSAIRCWDPPSVRDHLVGFRAAYWPIE